jgi:hypothetical protein
MWNMMRNSILALCLLGCSLWAVAQWGSASDQFSGVCKQNSDTCTIQLNTPTPSPAALVLAGRIGSATLQNKCKYVQAVTPVGDILASAPNTSLFAVPDENSGILFSTTSVGGATSLTVTRSCTTMDNWAFHFIVIPYSGIVSLDDSEGLYTASSKSWPGPILNLASGNDAIVEMCACGPNLKSVTPTMWSPAYFDDHLAVVDVQMTSFPLAPTFNGPTATNGVTAGIALGLQPVPSK